MPEGNYEDNGIDKISRLLLDNMTRVIELDSIPAQVKVSDLRKRFTKWRESASTSVSGRYLDYYKCLFQAIDRRLARKERENLRTIQETIADYYTAMINYAIKRHYSLKHWKSIANLMI